MEKMKFNILTREDEIALFLDKVEYFTNVRLPKAYLKNSKIVGAFLQDKLVGGYMLVSKPKFRSLMFVPDSIKKINPFFQNDTYEMLEVNGVWMGVAIKTPRMQFHFWMKLLKDILLAKKKYLLLMSSLKNKNIEYLHSLATPELLYEGTPNLMVGEQSHDKIRVGYTTRRNLVLNLPKYWIELKNRERRAKSFEFRRKLSRPIGISLEFGNPNVAR